MRDKKPLFDDLQFARGESRETSCLKWLMTVDKELCGYIEGFYKDDAAEYLRDSAIGDELGRVRESIGRVKDRLKERMKSESEHTEAAR